MYCASAGSLWEKPCSFRSRPAAPSHLRGQAAHPGGQQPGQANEKQRAQCGPPPRQAGSGVAFQQGMSRVYRQCYTTHVQWHARWEQRPPCPPDAVVQPGHLCQVGCLAQCVVQKLDEQVRKRGGTRGGVPAGEGRQG